jgi:hypothetical protein
MCLLPPQHMREGHYTLYLVLLSNFTLTLVKVKFSHFWPKMIINSNG